MTVEGSYSCMILIEDRASSGILPCQNENYFSFTSYYRQEVKSYLHFLTPTKFTSSPSYSITPTLNTIRPHYAVINTQHKYDIQIIHVYTPTTSSAMTKRNI